MSREGRRAPRFVLGSSGALAVGLCLAAVLLGRPAPAASPSELGVALYPGSIPFPEASFRLESLRNVRWRTAGAFRTDAPLSRVVDHFRGQAAALSGAAPSARLREWLEKNPEERAAYREFERTQKSSAAPEWETSAQTVADIPASLGGGTGIPAELARRPVEIAFGRVPGPGTVTSVQLVSPFLSADRTRLIEGTLIALIAEPEDPSPGSARPLEEVVEGPESSGLASTLEGTLVLDDPIGGLLAFSLPGLERTVVRQRNRAIGVVHSVSGPDSEGRIAYVENHAAEGRHLLKTIRVDGARDEQIFERKGDAVFELAIGSSIALAPRTGDVAFVGRLSRFRTARPAFPLRMGPLEIWSVEAKTGRETGIFALDRRLSWFPDGRRLAYVELEPSGRFPLPSDRATDQFGAGFASWEAVPVVRLLDVASGARRSLHVGWDPVVCSDGASVLVRDADNRWRLVDARSGASRTASWPGDAGGAIACAGGGPVLYWGLPTRGSPPEFTRVYSSALGPRPMKTLKIAILETPRFETLLPVVDPRREVAWGVFLRSR